MVRLIGLDEKVKLNSMRLPEASSTQWCCQFNASQSPKFVRQQVLGSDQLAPFEKGGVSELFKAGSCLDVSLMVEMIVH